MCGGDAISNQKQTAANSQNDLDAALTAAFKADQPYVQQLGQQLLQQGNPYFNSQVNYNKGTLAQQAAPLRAQLLQRMAGYGNTLPSGFATQAQTDFDTNLAQGFDNSVVQAENQNLATKEAGAQMLNPLGYAGAASGTAQSVLSAPPVQSGGFGNFLGGLASGLVNNASAGVGSTGNGNSAFLWSV